MDTAPPSALTYPSYPPLPLPPPPPPPRPRPRISNTEYFTRRPSPFVQETDVEVAFPQSIDAASPPMASLMPEPPGRMRREEYDDVRRGGNGNGSRRENGSRDSPIAIDLDGEVKTKDDGVRVIVNGEEKVPRHGDNGGQDHGNESDGALAGKAVGDSIVGARLDGGFREKLAQPAISAPDIPTDARLQRGHTTMAGCSPKAEGSSVEKPVVIDEGYCSFSSVADTSANEILTDPSYLEYLAYRKHNGEIDKLFEEDAGDANFIAFGGAKEASVEEFNRKQKAEEEAVIRKVNSLFRSHHSRAPDWRAEGNTFQVSSNDGHRPERLRTMNNGTHDLLEVVKREAQGLMQSALAARREGSRKPTSVLPYWQGELEARKRTAVERSRSARASDGNDNARRAISHKEVEAIGLDQEDDREQLKLAQERLIADMAGRYRAKHEKEQARLRKEKEANERARLVRGTRDAQKAFDTTEEKLRKKSRSIRDDEALMAAEARMIAERREEERRMKMNVDTAAKIKQDAERLASLKRKAANEAARRIERNRIEEERRAKTAESANRPSVRIKVEDTSNDDAVRTVSQGDRAARQAAAERSRNRQAQNCAEKPRLVGHHPCKDSHSGQTSVRVDLTSSGEVSGNRGTNPVHSNALESQLHQANEILQAAQAEKRLLELEAEARRVHAECNALKRRAEEADAEDVIDDSIHKKTRSIEPNVRENQPMVGSRNPSSVEDTPSAHDTETQAQGRPPARTLEERMNRKKETDKRWRLKKRAERALLQVKNRQEGIRRSVERHSSEVTSTESAVDDEMDTRQQQPMGLRALCTPGLTSHAKGLQKENNEAKSGEQAKPSKKPDQDVRQKSNADMNSVDQKRDTRAQNHMMKGRAAKDQEIDNIKARLATFQQPQTGRNSDPVQTGRTETYSAESPMQQERQETVTSDEDEDENQGAETAQSFRLSCPQQTLDLPEEARPTQPRPTCARKTLPAQVHDIISEEDDSGIAASEAQEEQPNEMVWGYQVIRKEWLNEEDPSDVGQTTDGPYWSKEQANSIAATEVHQERGNVKILAPMEFNMTIDALGMRTHSICSRGGNIVTAIERFLIPPSRAHGPMSDKAWLPQKIFVALEKVSLKETDPSDMTTSEHGPRTSSIRILGIFTVLDLANREASRCALDHQTSRLGESQLDQVVRAEKEMKAREHLQKLDLESKTFESSCALSDGSGGVEIWVEEHPVVGPRN